MGLLDINMPGMDTPEGQGLLSAAFSLMSAQKLPGQTGAMAGALGDAGRQYLGTTNDARNQSLSRCNLTRPSGGASKRRLTWRPFAVLSRQ
jgi:hypothetical protein